MAPAQRATRATASSMPPLDAVVMGVVPTTPAPGHHNRLCGCATLQGLKANGAVRVVGKGSLLGLRGLALGAGLVETAEDRPAGEDVVALACQLLAARQALHQRLGLRRRQGCLPNPRVVLRQPADPEHHKQDVLAHSVGLLGVVHTGAGLAWAAKCHGVDVAGAAQDVEASGRPAGGVCRLGPGGEEVHPVRKGAVDALPDLRRGLWDEALASCLLASGTRLLGILGLLRPHFPRRRRRVRGLALTRGLLGRQLLGDGWDPGRRLAAAVPGCDLLRVEGEQPLLLRYVYAGEVLGCRHRPRRNGLNRPGAAAAGTTAAGALVVAEDNDRGSGRGRAIAEAPARRRTARQLQDVHQLRPFAGWPGAARQVPVHPLPVGGEVHPGRKHVYHLLRPLNVHGRYDLLRPQHGNELAKLGDGAVFAVRDGEDLRAAAVLHPRPELAPGLGEGPPGWPERANRVKAALGVLQRRQQPIMAQAHHVIHSHVAADTVRGEEQLGGPVIYPLLRPSACL
mmetsp:Transcript_92616/g.276197  ORF Transcript_92616/g.276197 Transcript_92616/m.276197 type:complete len:511 (-) Transcript_92616:727-2259(-)